MHSTVQDDTDLCRYDDDAAAAAADDDEWHIGEYKLTADSSHSAARYNAVFIDIYRTISISLGIWSVLLC